MATTSRSLIWSPPHNCYYFISYDEYGQPTYDFVPQPKPENLHYTVPDASEGINYSQPDGNNGFCEPLDATYHRRPQEFFQIGKVFAILYTESAGRTSSLNGVDAYSQVRYGETVYSSIKRFVIVEVKQAFVYACAISTYSNRGTLKAGCVPSEHAVAYFTGTDPVLCYIKGEYERGMTWEPIEISPTEGTMKMKPESRIHFGKKYAIEKDIKAKDIGQVVPSSMTNFVFYSRGDGLESDNGIKSRIQGHLNPDYQVINNPRGFFKKGRVFMVPWPEPGGESTTDQSGPSTLVKIRRFVVIRPRANFCLCLPINTYQRQATTKPGVAAGDHAAVVVEGGRVQLHSGEKELQKSPMFIKVENESTGPIDSMSRMNFGKVYTVEYKVKVRNIGRILPESIWRMDKYFAECLMI